ncbi:hypothetical protein [Paenibacillus antarcticus]|uniref:hypothetical protein n=1 Tax=Paenibacillus antarcticus TaxID=253703 RepID=UPI000AD9DA54|nr:hypothetical protein [Paenibacillus antarcticus]
MLADTPSVFQGLDAEANSHVSMKQWKKPKTKVKMLLSLGVPKDRSLRMEK